MLAPSATLLACWQRDEGLLYCRGQLRASENVSEQRKARGGSQRDVRALRSRRTWGQARRAREAGGRSKFQALGQ